MGYNVLKLLKSLTIHPLYATGEQAVRSLIIKRLSGGTWGGSYYESLRGNIMSTAGFVSAECNHPALFHRHFLVRKRKGQPQRALEVKTCR